MFNINTVFSNTIYVKTSKRYDHYLRNYNKKFPSGYLYTIIEPYQSPVQVNNRTLFAKEIKPPILLGKPTWGKLNLPQTIPNSKFEDCQT